RPQHPHQTRPAGPCPGRDLRPAPPSRQRRAPALSRVGAPGIVNADAARGPCRYGPLQREVERSALLWRRSNPQLPAMALDDAPADCQSSACAATASARCVHTPEDGFLLLGSDADAVVANVERAAAARHRAVRLPHSPPPPSVADRPGRT